jgi:hypothetical protein
MDIEILNFFPQSPFVLTKGQKNGWAHIGTLCLFIKDFEMDLRGIRVYVKGKDFLFVGAGTREFRNNRMGIVNAFSFYNDDMRSEFHKFLQSKAKAYIKKIIKKDPDFFIPKPLENQELET